MGISSRSKNADIAWEFLKMLTYEKETQKDLYKYSQGISSLKSINKSEDIVCLLGKDNKENQINVNLLDEVMNKTLEHSRFKKYNQALNLIDIKINDMIRNKNDIDIGLLELQKDINKYLNE